MAGAPPPGWRRAAAVLWAADGGEAGDRVRVLEPEGARNVDSRSGAPSQHCQREEAALI